MLRIKDNRIINELDKDCLNLFSPESAVSLKMINDKINILFSTNFEPPEGYDLDFYTQQNNNVTDGNIDAIGGMVTDIYIKQMEV